MVESGRERREDPAEYEANVEQMKMIYECEREYINMRDTLPFQVMYMNMILYIIIQCD